MADIGCGHGASTVSTFLCVPNALSQDPSSVAESRVALRAMRASAQVMEDGWRQRLGAERLAGLRDTLVALLSPAP